VGLTARSDWFLVRGAADSIKPGVERSETPGSATKETSRARRAGDSGCDCDTS